MRKIVYNSLFCLLILLLSSCTHQKKTLLIEEDSQTLWNWKKGKEYQAEERFELAKEYFLYALASSQTDNNRQRITQDLEAVEMLLQTQR